MQKIILPKKSSFCQPMDLGAECEKCPLQNKAIPIPSENIRPSKLAILAEAPGRAEEIEGRPLIGQFGYILNAALKEAGVSRESTALLNILLCKPPKFLAKELWHKAYKACRPRLDRELAIVNPNTILTLGSRALWAMTGKQNVTPWYGAPLGKVFPATIDAHHKPAMRPVFKRWVKTAACLSNETLKPFQWRRLVTKQPFEPALLELLTLVNTVPDTTLSIDIENNPETQRIRCIGIGTDTLAVSIPLINEPVVETEEETGEIHTYEPTSPRTLELLRHLLSSQAPKVCHNAQHDIKELTESGFEVGGEIHDTLLMHAVVAPQLSHKLTDVAAFEMHAERWKTVFGLLGDDKNEKWELFVYVPYHKLLLYNAKDVQATAILKNRLWPQVERTHNGIELYENYRRLENLAMRMRQHGIKVDTSKFDGHRANLDSILKATREQFESLKFPEWVKLGATGQGPSLSRLYFDVFEVQPFSYNPESGKPSLDGKSLQKYATDTTLAPIVQGASRLLLKYRKHAKLKTAYLDQLPTLLDANHIAHPIARPWGTRTNRWAFNDPAIQTIPKPKLDEKKNVIYPGLRDLFCARPGMFMAEADYSQLELRILALLAGDKKLLEWYALGEDVHTLNAREIFKTKKPTKEQRDLAKRVVYGLNYGGSAETVWRSLLVDFPGLPLTNVIRVMDGWFKGHPEIKDWQDKQVELAKEQLYVEAPLSGRRLVFHDAHVEPTKVLNHPIQVTAGDVMNMAIQKIDKALNWANGEAILAQVHDAAVVEGPNEKRLVDILKENMEIDVELGGLRTKFPVDIKTGTNWGLLEAYKQCV